MANNEFLLKQHLKLSPNAQIKNLVCEVLNEDPLEKDWKIGRVWYNQIDGKFKCIKQEENNDGTPIENSMKIDELGSSKLGKTLDGEYYPDGLYNFNSATRIGDAVDNLNEALKDLAPAEATTLRGDMQVIPNNEPLIKGIVSDFDTDNPINIRLDNLQPGDSIDYIINDNKASLSLPEDGVEFKNEQQYQFGKADLGILSCYVDNMNIDSLPLKDLWNENARDFIGLKQGYNHPISQTYTKMNGDEITIDANPNKEQYWTTNKYIKITDVVRYNNFKKWQRGKGLLMLGYNDLNQSSLEAGKHSIYLKHHDVENGPFITNTTDIFVDPSLINNEKPTISSKELILNSVGEITYISGIPTFSNELVFKFDLSVDNLFKYTYWNTPIKLTMNNTNIKNIQWNSPLSNLKDKKVPQHSDKLLISEYLINYNKSKLENDTHINIKLGKPVFNWSKITPIKITLPINTLSQQSTSLKEFFTDEQYRLKIANYDDINDIASHTWNSDDTLTDNDAQVFQGVLSQPYDIVPKFEISKISNDIIDNIQIPDYSNLNGDTYIRYFENNKPNTNGALKITSNMTITDISDYTKIKLQMKLPGLTGWLDLQTLFDAEDFNNNFNEDGTGNQVGISQNGKDIIINWSSGKISTYDSNYKYVLKLILLDDTININNISEIGQGWY